MTTAMKNREKSCRAGLGAAAFLAAALLNLSAPAAESLSGRLLAATPDLTDPNFARTVIYMVRHDGNGAFGLVINEPVAEVPLDRLLADSLPEGKVPPDSSVLVHYGGPVRPGTGFILHSPEIMPAGSERIGAEVAISQDAALLEDSAAGRGPKHLLFIRGYAGWAAGQLEGEIARGGWYVLDWDEALVFGGDHGSKWDRAIALSGLEL